MTLGTSCCSWNVGQPSVSPLLREEALAGLDQVLNPPTASSLQMVSMCHQPGQPRGLPDTLLLVAALPEVPAPIQAPCPPKSPLNLPACAALGDGTASGPVTHPPCL